MNVDRMENNKKQCKTCKYRWVRSDDKTIYCRIIIEEGGKPELSPEQIAKGCSKWTEDCEENIEIEELSAHERGSCRDFGPTRVYRKSYSTNVMIR